jgi:Xaa-Pro aminopeptidase
MEARLVADIPEGAGWQYEPKSDGFRCLVFKDQDQIQLQSKSGQPLTRYYPELAEAVGPLKARFCVLDGEIVIPAGDKFSFNELLLRIHPAASRVQKLATAAFRRLQRRRKPLFWRAISKMKPIAIDPGLFNANRERLRKLLLKNSVAVVNANDLMPTNADGTMGFHQNADLFYLTGIRQEESILVLAPDAFDEKMREVLFLREPNEHLHIWEGHKVSKDEATAISGIKTTKWLSDFRSLFHQLMCESEQVYLNSNEHYRAQVEVESRDARFVRDCQRRYPLHQYHRLARLMHQLRVIKSPAEIALIKEASGITGLGLSRVLKFVKPGVNEGEIEAEFAHEFIRRRAGFAYLPIIATGENNCVLHYSENDQVCQAGQLVLLDVAAGYGNYMSDLTRTIPVSGRFTRRQRQVYDAVLRTFRQVLKSMVPGKTILDLRKEAESLIEKECLELGLLRPAQIRKQDPDNPAVRKYFMHGVAHPIGLDVHDVLSVRDTIKPGWVLTCEPAIYIQQEKFGVRLENTVLITESGQEDLMRDIPIEADEIEECMRR